MTLEYLHGTEFRTALWEPMDGGVLETTFDSDGALVNRVFVEGRSDGKAAESMMNSLANSVGVGSMIAGEYSEVRLKRRCPTCSTDSLRMFIDSEGGRPKVPVMPIYECTSCSCRSYYLTDQYLEYLVDKKRELFSLVELHELGADKGAFMRELREYIIRIFASKRITQIK